MANPASQLQNPKSYVGDRFASILRGSHSDQSLCDRPLFKNADWIVVPTLGAIVANWLIIVPYERALSLRDWQKQYDRSVNDIVDILSLHLGIDSTELVWFEHGPAHPLSSVGCGTDYAHLHLIFNPCFVFSEFVEKAMAFSRLNWIDIEAMTAYSALPDGDSYLIAGSGDRAVLASRVESAGSQFFRRVISDLTVKNNSWDYRHYPHTSNIKKTINNFQALANPACSSERYYGV